METESAKQVRFKASTAMSETTVAVLDEDLEDAEAVTLEDSDAAIAGKLVVSEIKFATVAEGYFKAVMEGGSSVSLQLTLITF